MIFTKRGLTITPKLGIDSVANTGRIKIPATLTAARIAVPIPESKILPNINPRMRKLSVSEGFKLVFVRIVENILIGNIDSVRAAANV